MYVENLLVLHIRCLYIRSQLLVEGICTGDVLEKRTAHALIFRWWQPRATCVSSEGCSPIGAGERLSTYNRPTRELSVDTDADWKAGQTVDPFNGIQAAIAACDADMSGWRDAARWKLLSS